MRPFKVPSCPRMPQLHFSGHSPHSYTCKVNFGCVSNWDNSRIKMFSCMEFYLVYDNKSLQQRKITPIPNPITTKYGHPQIGQASIWGRILPLMETKIYKICLKYSGNKCLTASIQVKKYSSSSDFVLVSLTKSSSCLLADGGFERQTSRLPS